MEFQKNLRVAFVVFITALLAACASSDEKEGLDQIPKNAADAANAPVSQAHANDEAIESFRPPTDTQVVAQSEGQNNDGFQIELKKIKDLADSSHAKHEAHASPAHHEATPAGVTPEKALGWLKNGNTRFRKGNLRKDGQSRKDIASLAAGQKPHTILVSCSDSRTPPEILFDQKLGEVFVIRTAGQALDHNAIASVEYAVEHLGVRNVVVMGHTQCGAVKAAWTTAPDQSAGSESLDHLVNGIRPRLAPLQSKGLASKNFEAEGWANAEGVAADLVARSKILQTKAAGGDIKVSSALYHLESGQVDFKH
jgi:carbonic anhydrase